MKKTKDPKHDKFFYQSVYQVECDNCGHWHSDRRIACPRCGTIDVEKFRIKRIQDSLKQSKGR